MYNAYMHRGNRAYNIIFLSSFLIECCVFFLDFDSNGSGYGSDPGSVNEHSVFQVGRLSYRLFYLSRHCHA